MGRKKTGKNSGVNKAYALMRQAHVSNQITTVSLPIFGTISSNGSGEIKGAFGMDPSGANKWSHYASIFDMFRVVGGVLRLVPVCTNIAVANALVLFAFDNDSTATPTAATDLSNYAEVTQLPAVWTSGGVRTVPFMRPMKGGTVQSTTALWLDEATPSGSLGGLKFYGSGLNNSTSYYSYELEYIVQFMYRS